MHTCALCHVSETFATMHSARAVRSVPHQARLTLCARHPACCQHARSTAVYHFPYVQSTSVGSLPCPTPHSTIARSSLTQVTPVVAAILDIMAWRNANSHTTAVELSGGKGGDKARRTPRVLLLFAARNESEFSCLDERIVQEAAHGWVSRCGLVVPFRACSSPLRCVRCVRRHVHRGAWYIRLGPPAATMASVFCHTRFLDHSSQCEHPSLGFITSICFPVDVHVLRLAISHFHVCVHAAARSLPHTSAPCSPAYACMQGRLAGGAAVPDRPGHGCGPCGRQGRVRLYTPGQAAPKAMCCFCLVLAPAVRTTAPACADRSLLPSPPSMHACTWASYLPQPRAASHGDQGVLRQLLR